MKNPQALISVLDKIVDLLVTAGEENWSNAFINLRDRVEVAKGGDSKNPRADILRVYGGMGSFNDLVLYRQGQPLINENRKLDVLRSELFKLLIDEGVQRKE